MIKNKDHWLFLTRLMALTEIKLKNPNSSRTIDKKEIEIKRISIFKGLTELDSVRLLNKKLMGIILNDISKIAPRRAISQNVWSSRLLILIVGLNKIAAIKAKIVNIEIIIDPINIKSHPELL